MPADLLEVFVKGKEAVVLSTVGADFDELTAILHEVQTVRGCKERRKDD